MRITWVTRSFLDYRLPVYRALDELCGHELTLIYNGDVNPERCKRRVAEFLGERAIALHGEKRLTGAKSDNATMANRGYRIPVQKGLVKAIRESKPDVIVSDGFFQWTYAALIVRMFNLKGIRHVMCYERTPHTERNAGKLRTMYRRFVSRWIDVIDCNGVLTAEYVRDTLKYRKPLAYGHMTADTDGVAARVAAVDKTEVDAVREEYRLNGLTFLYLGQLIPRKGIMQMLAAWKEARLEDATLMLVGDGVQRAEIEAYVRDNGLDNVRIVGAVNYDDLGPYYKAADCFIIPTLEDNWSLVVPEAMAAGLPVACSIYNGCHPELVQPENGWTFDPLGCAATAHTLRQISESRASLAEMGAASRRIVANHTPAHAAKGIYEACVDTQSY